MKRISLLVAMALAAAVLVVPPSSASVFSAIDGPSGGGLSSDNVEWVRHVPLAIDGVGGRLIDGWFDANDQNKIMIFDIKNPEDPQMVGFLPMPQEVYLSREDIDGNGELLIVPNTVG